MNCSLYASFFWSEKKSVDIDHSSQGIALRLASIILRKKYSSSHRDHKEDHQFNRFSSEWYVPSTNLSTDSNKSKKKDYPKLDEVLTYSKIT